MSCIGFMAGRALQRTKQGRNIMNITHHIIEDPSRPWPSVGELAYVPVPGAVVFIAELGDYVSQPDGSYWLAECIDVDVDLSVFTDEALGRLHVAQPVEG